MRVYNITHEPVTGTLTVGVPLASAARVNMAEDLIAPLALDDDQHLTISVAGAEVVTLRLTPRL